MNRYISNPTSLDDVDEDLYLFPSYGRGALLRQTHTPNNFSIRRDDLILWDAKQHQAEFDKVVRIPSDLPSAYRDKLVSTIQRYWDSFIASGVCRPVLNYEFCIDTGNANPVCCKPPRYGVHESAEINRQLRGLLDTGWISTFPELSGWCSQIVLAPKPHQEHVTNIDDFIWRLCVSYRGLNAVTLVYGFPIPRCDEAIDNFAPGGGRLYWISVDAKSGFHQIKVRYCDREKLCFAGPNGILWTFNVMPFGPVNAPACYTVLMFLMRQEWQALFRERFPDIDPTTIDVQFIQTGDRQIVDDILLFSNDPVALLLYFDCVCHIFTKWRLSFNPKKCDFFLDRVEWIGFDLRPDGNSPAASKYDCVRNWPTPTTGQSLHSFVGLLNFYARFIPHFEIRVGPLRQLVRTYHRKPIPASAWTQDLLTTFTDLKQALLSDPILRRYDSSLPTFLKTDWSKTGMSFILMQPEDSDAARLLLSTINPSDPSTVQFDLTIEGARLQPVFCASRRCSPTEAHYHSFVGETAAGRWAFSVTNSYIWGTHFYWICDCNAVSKIAEYHGPSHQLRRWSQEMLAYTWTTIHRNAHMMIDVDALNRGRYLDSLRDAKVNSYIVEYEHHLAASLNHAFATSPAIFNPTLFPQYTTKCPDFEPATPITPPTASASTSSLFSFPITLHPSSNPQPTNQASTVPSSSTSLLEPHSEQSWISINCRFATLHQALRAAHPSLSSAPFLLADTCAFALAACQMLFPDCSFSSSPINQIINSLLQQPQPNQPCPFTSKFLSHNTRITGLDWFCTSSDPSTASAWLRSAISCIVSLATSHSLSCAILLGLPPVSTQLSALISQICPTNWTYQSSTVTASNFGDSVAATRWYCILTRDQPGPQPPTTSDFSECLSQHQQDPQGYQSHLDSFYNYNQQQLPADHTTPADISLYEPLPLGTTSPHSFCFDPDYPAPESTAYPDGPNPFGSSFGVPIPNPPLSSPAARPIHPMELAAAYSLAPNSTSARHAALSPCFHLPFPIISHLFLTTLPTKCATAIASALVDCHLGPTLDPIGKSSENVVTLTLKPSLPTASAWQSGYQSDPTLKDIYAALSSNPNHCFPESFIKTMPSTYQGPLRDKHISITHGRLTYSQPLSRNGRALLLIIPPESLRHHLFTTLHSSPSAGHLKYYKTLHRIRLRFFWHKLRSDVEQWIKSCPDCILSNSTIRHNSELVYSWPVTSPFAIIHLDIYQPGEVASFTGSKYFLAAMCNLTGFSILVDLPTVDSATLAAAFMKDVLLRVGFCLLVCPDADSKFKAHFTTMCEALNLPCKPGLKGNHKSVLVERLFNFFNRALAIASNQRSNDNRVSVEALHCANYAWNASCIDGTDIIRSVPAIGRPFRFPIDCNLSATPEPSDDYNTIDNLYEFLRLGQSQSEFATHILRYLTEDRRSNAAARANANRNLKRFKVDDIVTAAVQVQSSATDSSVAKLSYRRRGPFLITEVLPHGHYRVRKLHASPDSATQDFHGQVLELLPPSLWPCEPTDGPDQRFLDIHVPELPIELRRPLGCESYNHQFFDPEQQTLQPKDINTETPCPLQDSPTTSPSIPTDPSLTLPNTDLTALHTSILASKDRLFFIAYRFSRALRPQYALVTVDLEQPFDITTGTYYCHFLAAPTCDKQLPEQDRRWWPLWHKYRTAQDGVIEYQERIEFHPTITPDPTRYIAWADSVCLANPDSFLSGPFNFTEPSEATDRSRTPSYRQFVHTTHWLALREQCLSRGVIPPTLAASTKAPRPNSTRRSKRKRNRQPSH